MLLSIIVPCYNVGPAIQNLLFSITSQLDSNCELILIDDGSTDGTGDRIQQFIDNSHIAGKVILQKFLNAGAATARERGYRMARGDFIYFCDSDDIIHDQFIASFNQYLNLYPNMEMLFLTADMAIEKEGELERVSIKLQYPNVVKFKNGHELLQYNLERKMYTSAVWTYIARRTLLNKSNALFTDRKAHEDHLYTLRAIMNASVIVGVPELLYTQKIRAGSLTNSAKDVNYVMDRIEAYNEASEFLQHVHFHGIRLYRQWSFDSIAGMLRENKALIPGLLRTKVGVIYLITCLPSIIQMLIKKALRQ